MSDFKGLLFLGKDEDGKDLHEILRSNKKVLKEKIKQFQLQKFASGVEIAVGAFFIYVPEKVKLGKLNHELQLAKLREEKASGQMEYLEIKLDALKNDPTFLEIQSRDRLQLYRPGETIFRIERP
jgi:cell division protein FtsB